MSEEFIIPPDAKQNPLVKLDVVLMFLSIQTYMQTMDEIHRGVYDYIESDDNEISLILGKLEKDNFIIKQVLPTHDVRSAKMIDIYHFAITFDGKFFLKQIGYNLQAINNASENTRLERLETELKENRRWTLYLTILIAVGTLVAAIYYGIEIYKGLHLFAHHHERYWIWETIPKGTK